MLLLRRPVLLIIVYMLGVLVDSSYGNSINECYPVADSSIPHYLIGYGSLVQRDSLLHTVPNAGQSIPVRIHEFRRSWNAQGRGSKGYDITYLGVEENRESSFNGVIFHLPTNSTNANDVIGALDFREDWYCRKKVSSGLIHFLTSSPGEPIPEGTFDTAAIWIYVTRPEFRHNANEKYPIYFAYVDTFLGGCIDVEEHSQIIGFARECVTSTHNWTTHWVNNRLKSTTAAQTEGVNRLLEEGLDDIYPNIKFQKQSGAARLLTITLFPVFLAIMAI